MKNRSLIIVIVCCLAAGLKGQQPAVPAVAEQAGNGKALPLKLYINGRSGLENTHRLLTAHRKITVAFLGGSITYNPGWRELVGDYLKATYPLNNWRLINAGIPSLGSLPHAFRLQRDVLDSGKIDLLFVEAAVNDRVNGTDSVTQLRALEGIVRHAKKSNPQMDIILLSFADPDKTANYNKGIVPAEIANHERIAGHYRLPSINLAKAVRDKMANREFSWAADFKDLHPSPFGQKIYFDVIRELLINCFSGTSEKLKPASLKRLPIPLEKAAFEKGSYTVLGQATHDDGWILDSNWSPKDKLSTRDGFVHVPVLMSEKAGAVLSLPFKGTAVGIAVVSGADAGMIAISIDDAPYKNIDLFTPWSSQLHLPWYLLMGSDLNSGQHVLKIRILDEKNNHSLGNACRIVHFLVNE